MKRIVILGSTGSIGVNTLRVVSLMRGRFEVIGLAARADVETLASQAKAFRPAVLCVADPVHEKRLRRLVASKAVRIESGEEGLLAMVSRSDVDVVVAAMSGNAGLAPLMKAIACGKQIALANKEALVSAGELVMAHAASCRATIVPIDSEHSAIFQCLEGCPRDYVRRLLLTSSGGPLLRVDPRRFKKVTKETILAHPKWKMGRKITVDSATLMNKGLEVIEARWLFGVPGRDIRVLVHPEAVVHSLVELVDGSVLAQLAVPDMRLPIQYALTYPERRESPVARLDLVKQRRLTFEEPDTARFPCLALAREALTKGGPYPAVLNAADEVAVTAFLDGAIPFYRIPAIIEKVIGRFKRPAVKRLDITQVREADEWARSEARRLCCR